LAPGVEPVRRRGAVEPGAGDRGVPHSGRFGPTDRHDPQCYCDTAPALKRFGLPPVAAGAIREQGPAGGPAPCHADFAITRQPAIMSCSACLRAVKPAMMKPI